MKIEGDAITAFTAKVLLDYQPLQRFAISWRQLSSGNWAATDRGTTADSYECRVSLHGLESDINTFVDKINTQRLSGNNQITLSEFKETEKIFGHNINHSTLTAIVMDMPKRARTTFKGWTFADVYLKLISTPSFVGLSTMPTLQFADFGGEADSDYTFAKKESFTGAITHQDMQSDSGIFEAEFTFKNTDFINMLNYIRVTRSADMTLADTFGVAYPFGTRSIGSYPFTVKLIEWEDRGYFGLLYRKLRLRFAEVI